MTLTVSQVAEWLTLRGYSKVDGQPTKDGGWLTANPGEKHWSLFDYPEHGCSFLSITPEQEAVEGADGDSYSDMSLHLRIESDRVVGVDVGQSYSGAVIACAKQPPATTDDLLTMLQVGREVFRQMVLAMPMETPPRSNEEISAEVARYIEENPQAMELFTTPEEEEG